MVKQLVCIAVLTAFVVVLPRGYAEPRDGWSLEERVPASTLALVTVEDVGKLGERFEKTAIAGLFREPEVKAFAAPIEKAIEDLFSSERGSPFGEASPFVWNVIEQLAGLEGQVAVALLDMNLDTGEPRIAVSLDFGAHIADFAAFLGRMRMQLDPQGEAIAQFQKDGRTWWQNQAGGPRITATTVDTAFVLATDSTLLEGVVAGKGESPLSAHEHFLATRRKAAGGGDLALLAYANVPAIVDMLEPMMDNETRAIANALGLDTVQAAAYGLAFAGDGFMDNLIVHAPGADHGLMTLIEMPPYQPKALHHAPANAFLFNESSANLSELVGGIRRLGASISPDFADEMNEGLSHLKNMLGVDIEHEVVAGLTGASAVYAAIPETGGLYPEVAIFLQVRDPKAYATVFDRLARGIAGAVTEEGDVIASTRTIPYRDHALHLFEMQRARGNDVVPFTPTWAMLDDWLVLTLVPHAMKEIILRQEQPQTGGGLAAQEDFQSLRAVLPPEAGEFTYIDLQGILSLLYDTGIPLLQTVAKPNVIGREIPFPLDWAQLPAARTVRPYFRSLGIFTTWNRDGIALRMHGPIPLVGAVVIVAAVAVPMLAWGGGSVSARAREGGSDKRRSRRQPRLMPTPPPPSRPPMAAPERRANLQVEQLSGFVRVFLLTERRLPKTLDDLKSADILGTIPKDPWGHPFRLRILDEKTRRFQVVSAGQDGKFDTKDDIHSGG